jgi:hypothetical protein
MTKKKDDILEHARKRLDQIITQESDIREAAINDQKMENGQQWTDADKQFRKGRPSFVVNRESGIVKAIVGDMRQNRARIKVRPVDDQGDVQIAEIFNGLISNIENISEAEVAYDNAGECAVRSGYGYWRVNIDYLDDDSVDQDILIERIVNPFSVYYDQSGTKADYTDAKDCFITEEVDKEDLEEQYPNASFDSIKNADGDNMQNWSDNDTVLLAEYWWKEPCTKELFRIEDGRTIEVEKPEITEVPNPEEPDNPIRIVMGDPLPEPMLFTKHRKVQGVKVMWVKMTGTEILDGPNEWPGKYIPIIPCLGEEVYVDGKRHLRSAIRHAHDSQRLYNWARSNAVETMALSPKQPFMVTPHQIEGHEQTWADAGSKPMPYLPYNPDPQAPGMPQRMGGSSIDQGALQETLQAAEDVKVTTGLFDASMGAQGNETSGRAIIARQRESDTATYVFPDNQSRAIKHTGRVLVDLIPKVYDEQRRVRLMGPEGQEAWVMVNQSLAGEEKINDLSIGKFDVTVDAGPGFMTKRLEAADAMLNILGINQALAPILIPEVAKNLDWPGATEIGQKIEQFFSMQMQAPQPEPPNPKDMAYAEKLMKEAEGTELENELKKIAMAERLIPEEGDPEY